MFAKHGDKRAEAVLFRTVDGGVSWIKLAHPEPVAEGQQMYLGGPQTVVLLSEPSSWHVSTDGGVTWRRSAYSSGGEMPAEYPRGSDSGPFYLDRGPNYDGPTVIRDSRQTGFSSPVPAKYDHGSLTNETGLERVWLAAISDGRPITMVSHRGTQAFVEVAVPEQKGRPLFMVRVVISADGEDVWLLADQEDVGASGGGKSLMRGSVLKGTGLPLVWKLERAKWVPKPLRGIEEKPGWPYSVAPVGEGWLLVAGPGQTGYAGGEFQPVPGTPELDYAMTLRDGTIHGGVNRQGVVYLGDGQGNKRDWIKVEVSPR